MKELEYPFDSGYIMRKKKKLRKELLKASDLLPRKIAILGGSTTHDIREILELFLLNQGILPEFYESEYNQYYRDARYGNIELNAFSPDIVYLCTTFRNILSFPSISDSKDSVDQLLDQEVSRFREMWKHLEMRYHCMIIQNNFEFPDFRLLGNMDASDIHGRTNFITRLNLFFYEYASHHSHFHICDINYLSSVYGLDRWFDISAWHMYKYAMSVSAIPHLSFQVANIIKSIFGKNKKALNLDLDNTLWGGIVGDDGVENIEIGQETPVAQGYTAFQHYLKLLKQIGILLTINSKNEEAAARAGLAHPDSVLTEEDFISIKANWRPKDQNLLETAADLSLLPESFVFADDNPAERAIIRGSLPGVAVPELSDVEQYIRIIDRSGFFEITSISEDDLERNRMYLENAKRTRLQSAFENYDDYLTSLDMKAEIRSFTPLYMPRIAQLTNKSNQFNLTTKRYSLSELEGILESPDYLTLYGKLTDRFGDNGIVSIIIGRIDSEERTLLHIDLWLMSCRVLMRNMEYAMMDELVKSATAIGIQKLRGYYFPTPKNAMVKDFYSLQGFQILSEDPTGATIWEYKLSLEYKNKNHIIKVMSV